MTEMDFLEDEIENKIKLLFPDIEFELDDIDIGKDKIKILHHIVGNKGVSSDIDILPEYLENRFFKKSVSGNILYHFIPLKYAFNILKDNKIRLYDLNKYLEDDSKEFSYFIDEMGIVLPNYVEQINSMKENNFIFSCSSDNKSDKHWKRFGATEKVICLKLKINFIEQKDLAIEVKKVVYGSALLKLFSFKRDLLVKHNKELIINKWSSFLKFTKRDVLDWEKEVRLCFDNSKYNLNSDGVFASKQDVYCDNGDSYIEFPLKNDCFELSIEEVQIREDNWQSDLSTLCNAEGFILKKV